jgi:hypothetical protein
MTKQNNKQQQQRLAIERYGMWDATTHSHIRPFVSNPLAQQESSLNVMPLCVMTMN